MECSCALRKARFVRRGGRRGRTAMKLLKGERGKLAAVDEK